MNTRDQAVANLLEAQRQEIRELRKRIEKVEALWKVVEPPALSPLRAVR